MTAKANLGQPSDNVWEYHVFPLLEAWLLHQILNLAALATDHCTCDRHLASSALQHQLSVSPLTVKSLHGNTLSHPCSQLLDCYTLDCPPPHWRWCWQTKSRPNHGPMPPAPLQRPDSSCMTLVQLTPKTRPPPSCPLKISSAMVCWKDFAQTQL